MRRLSHTRKRRDAARTVGKATRRAAQRRQFASRRVVAGGAVALAVVAGIGLWRAGWMAEAPHHTGRLLLSASAGMGLTVREVLLEGRRYAPRSQIAAAIGVKRGDPLLGVEIGEIRERLETLSWVRSARVERDWPGTIRVLLDERSPVALWQRDGKLHVVDAEGVTLTDDNIGRFRHLLVIVGKDAPVHATDLLDTLETEPSLRARVLAAVRVGQRRWDIRFKSGVDVRLPERNPTAAWAKLAQMERRHGLINDKVDVIDMRLPDRLIVRAKSAEPKRRIAARGQPT